jgi:hypothetical protein
MGLYSLRRKKEKELECNIIRRLPSLLVNVKAVCPNWWAGVRSVYGLVKLHVDG